VNPDELAALSERVANNDELAALVSYVANEHPEIRLMCGPGGHFIKAVQIGALGPLLWIYPAIGRRHETTGPIPAGQRPWPARREDSGFTQDGGPDGSVTLSCKRCPRWRLTRDAKRLAVELAVYALGRILVGSLACSCGRHLTWRYECGAVTYGPALANGCSLLDGPARVR
jgi:hypothetical protein